jgi:hypothetical protein
MDAMFPEEAYVLLPTRQTTITPLLRDADVTAEANPNPVVTLNDVDENGTTAEYPDVVTEPEPI